ncbi:hypothetical protein HPB49_006424 [Dermacentor silvarum]|uniref:Uncharacterized protein n=1 Tax=Dermacentor silvarum TaxID=543639 RepID=A0ACB8C7Q1_DERSI|nr:hypothetical protein HPB49_006424 [Dermacentor silvarum]
MPLMLAFSAIDSKYRGVSSDTAGIAHLRLEAFLEQRNDDNERIHARKQNKRDQEQVDAIIRGAYKTALGLPVTTSNEKLATLGIDNTFAELSDAVMASQKARLQNTAPGRAILHRTGTTTEQLPPEVRSKITANPIPKHMSHELHEGRRKARVDRQRRQFKNDPNVTYVDVAAYPAGGLFAVAPVNGRQLLNPRGLRQGRDPSCG